MYRRRVQESIAPQVMGFIFVGAFVASRVVMYYEQKRDARLKHYDSDRPGFCGDYECQDCAHTAMGNLWNTHEQRLSKCDQK